MSESTILWNDDELWIDSQLWDAVGTDFYISTASIALLGIAPEYLVETVFDCPSAELHVTAVAPELVDAVFSVPTAAITIQAGDVSLQLVYGVATATIAVAGVDAELIFSSFNVETAEITVAGVAATFAVDAFDVATAEITVAGIDADFVQTAFVVTGVGLDAQVQIVKVGEAVPIGQVIYYDRAAQAHRLASSTTEQQARVRGMSVTNAEATGDSVVSVLSGSVIMSGLIEGTEYYVGRTAGQIIAETALASGDYVTRVGIAKSSNVLHVDIEQTGVTL